MVGAFTWTASKRKRGQPESGKESRFYFRDGIYTNTNVSFASWNEDKHVLNIEVNTDSPYEWHDTHAMYQNTGRTVASALKAPKWLYYTEQPSKARDGSRRNVYFQQFCARLEEKPKDEDLIAIYGLMQDAPVEGEECGEYKMRRFNAGAAAKGRGKEEMYRKKRREAKKAEAEDKEQYVNELKREFKVW